jgi:hypothetical protein
MDLKIKEILEIAKIENFEKLTDKDILEITKLQGQNKLTEKHTEALVNMYPDFVRSQVEIVKAFTNTIDNITKEHITTYNNIRATIDSLSEVIKIIASKDDNSEAVKIKLIETSEKLGDKYLEILKIQEDMNNDNNNLAKRAIALLGTALILGFGFFMRGNSNNT